MANIQIGSLPTYTGDTTGVYLVMNDSGNTQTYKVEKETLISGGGIQFPFKTAPGKSYVPIIAGNYIELTDTTPLQTWIVAYPITPAQTISMSAITCDWFRTQGGTNGKIKLLLYDNDDTKLVPKTLLYESPAISVSAFSVLQYNISTTLNAGTTYWLGIAFNDSMSGPSGNMGMRGFAVSSITPIGTPTFSDGYGLMWKCAVSQTDASLTIPSTWVIPTGIQAFYGSYLWESEGGYYGGSNTLPEIRIKTT